MEKMVLQIAGMGTYIYFGTGDQFMRISGSATDGTISDINNSTIMMASHGAGFDITTSGTVTLAGSWINF